MTMFDAEEALAGALDLDRTRDAFAAALSFTQLQAWRARGYAPHLHSTPDGWVLILDTTMEITERTRSEALRYCTAPCETPQAAIDAALQAVQP